MEQLRRRIDKVERLGDKQQDQRLAEVSEDAVDGEDHARKVAVRVPHKHLSRIPVVLQEGQ